MNFSRRLLSRVNLAYSIQNCLTTRTPDTLTQRDVQCRHRAHARGVMGVLHRASAPHSASLTSAAVTKATASGTRGTHHMRTNTPICLMLTTHCRISPRLSRGLAHVLRGHSVTTRHRLPPGRCLSSAPSAYTDSRARVSQRSHKQRLCGPK